MSQPVYTSKLTVVEKQFVGSDAAICDAARVSTLGDEADDYVRNETADAKLLRYLMNNKHGSPFEHGSITYIVTAPIFVFWDHVRHRIGVSYNIESSRYRELSPTFFVADAARTQTGRPGHYVMSEGSPEQTILMREANDWATSMSWRAYQTQLDAGIAREQAMQVLPMNTVITAYVTFNPRSLMNFLELRLGPARKEMQQIAAEYLILAMPHWPETLTAFGENGRVAP
jgi:thymidylate synthase (FAD)